MVVGSLNLDIGLVVDRLPRPGETVLTRARQDGPGGKGLNQAVAAARAGAPTSMVGSVGDDAAGRALLDALIEAAVDVTDVLINSEVATGTAVVAVDRAGSNQILVVPGANGSVDGQRAQSMSFGPGDVVVAQGEIPLASTLTFFQQARRAGARTILNLAPFHAPPAGLLEATSVLVVNETELIDLVSSLGMLEADSVDGSIVATTARELVDRGVDAVVVTLGGAGMVAITAEGVLAEPARSVRAVDTTGAGDAVVGVLAAELAIGADLVSAMATRAEIDATGSAQR